MGASCSKLDTAAVNDGSEKVCVKSTNTRKTATAMRAAGSQYSSLGYSWVTLTEFLTISIAYHCCHYNSRI